MCFAPSGGTQPVERLSGAPDALRTTHREEDLLIGGDASRPFARHQLHEVTRVAANRDQGVHPLSPRPLLQEVPVAHPMGVARLRLVARELR
eukprot:CAMPEP_0182837618 /NCGR_PEP_ID=MMETSP0006_2-20121128/22820_1 /TAXON_ID=97485 /ORGANISM="Prymnesium parvum, Strain Texoma1" /LENGTH=91 /DNA_ID=CAMNT_0024966495 /DNA_START=242 /DNA_END=514 /DNA_ORIENTATION=-